jgi:hypothetical protein
MMGQSKQPTPSDKPAAGRKMQFESFAPMIRFTRHVTTVRTAPRFPMLAFCVCVAGVLLLGSAMAEDIVSLDGKRYENVRDITPMREGVVFSYGPATNSSRTTVLFRDLPQDLQKKYGYDPFEEGLANARFNRPVSLTLNSAFRLSTLDAAKKKAQAEGKPLGFIMVWDMMFRPGSRPMSYGGNNALAGFYSVFNNALVLVFVRHEDELNLVPDSVKQGFFGPEEGGWAPNMAVVTADCSQFICEIPLGGEHSTGAMREPIFRQKIAVIKKFLENPPPVAPKPVEQTNTETTAETAAVQPAKTEADPGDIIPGQRLEGIRNIPQQTRLLYGGIAVGALILLVLALRLFRRKTG